jgi:hypothetical protein
MSTIEVIAGYVVLNNAHRILITVALCCGMVAVVVGVRRCSAEPKARAENPKITKT